MTTLVCVLVTLLSTVYVHGNMYGGGRRHGSTTERHYYDSDHGGVSAINGIHNVVVVPEGGGYENDGYGDAGYGDGGYGDGGYGDGGYGDAGYGDGHSPPGPLTEHHVVFEDNGRVTKIHVFSYVMNETSTLGFSMLKKVVGKTMQMSLLDRYDLGPSKRGLYLADDLKMFMNFAKEHIPNEKHASTNVAFLASSDYWHASEKCWKILDEARSLLTDPDFTQFKVAEPADVQVMSGEQQGAWSWVALNYDHITGYIEHMGHDENEAHHIIAPSNGVMGLTQRSAFIAFLPDNGATSGTYTITLGNTKFNLYAKSHVGFGTADVMSRLVEDHSVQSGEKFTNPCLLHDDVWEVSPSRNVTGTGEPAACMDLINNLLKVRNCPVDKCSIGDEYQPDLPKDMTFYATKDFILAPLNVSQESGHYLDTVHRLCEGISYCHNETHFLKSPMESVMCLLSLYTPLLLHAFGDPGQSNKVIAASQFHGVDIEPALGMVVMEIYERSEHIKQAEYGSSNPEAGDEGVEGVQPPSDDDTSVKGDDFEYGSEGASEYDDEYDSSDGYYEDDDDDDDRDDGDYDDVDGDDVDGDGVDGGDVDGDHEGRDGHSDRYVKEESPSDEFPENTDEPENFEYPTTEDWS